MKVSPSALRNLITTAKNKYNAGGMTLLLRYCDEVITPIYGYAVALQVFQSVEWSE